ncbi:hypothetical protein N7454_000875 [Penicillium verhagenii]|nr:hypothetical protein N7454_000875 [Penicillium verhagenii]
MGQGPALNRLLVFVLLEPKLMILELVAEQELRRVLGLVRVRLAVLFVLLEMELMILELMIPELVAEQELRRVLGHVGVRLPVDVHVLVFVLSEVRVKDPQLE